MSCNESRDERRKRLALGNLKRVGTTADGQMQLKQFLFFLDLADKYKFAVRRPREPYPYL